MEDYAVQQKRLCGARKRNENKKKWNETGISRKFMTFVQTTIKEENNGGRFVTKTQEKASEPMNCRHIAE